jgi:HK97 family phage prohead protease
MIIDKEALIDAPERRGIPTSQFDVRSEGNELKFEGYASTFDAPYDIYGGPPSGWHEIVTREAFKKTLTEKPDLHLLINHEGMPLARTKSGTMQLLTDNHGLLVRANLDRRDPMVQSLQVKMERGDMDQMSFAFRVKKQTWSDDETHRYLDEVSLHKGDVSVVNFGANPTTSATIRSAIELLAGGPLQLDARCLAWWSKPRQCCTACVAQ